MSNAMTSISLRGGMLLIIVSAQLLTPLLHGHIGIPKQTGLHMHVGLSGTADSQFRSHDASNGSLDGLHVAGSQLNAEPVEVDVEPAIGPLALAVPILAVAVLGVSALTFMLLAALARCATPLRAFYSAPVRARWRKHISRPPLAQAPPLFPPLP